MNSILKQSRNKQPLGYWLELVFCVGVCVTILGGSVLAQTKPTQGEKGKKDQTPSWFPSEIREREKEIAEKILAQKDDEVKHLAFASLVRHWIQNDREAALSFDEAQKNQRVRQTFFYAAAPIMIEADPEFVLKVANSGRWWPDQYYHVGTATQKLAHKDLDAAIEAFRAMSAKLQTFDSARTLARLLTKREGADNGLSFARSIETLGAQEGAVRGAMHQWVQMDEAAAVTYAEDQKNNRDKSIAVLCLLAGKGRNQKPQEVLDWVKTLGEDRMRRLALSNLAWLWNLEGNRSEVDRILNDDTISFEDRNVMEEQLKGMGVALP